jgi:hypothetical protein
MRKAHDGKSRQQRRHDDQSRQGHKFIEAARELGADQSEEAFDEALRKIAQAPARKGSKSGKTKKPPSKDE